MVVRVNSLVFSAVVILVYLSLLSLNVHAGKDKDVRKRPPTRTSGSAADAPDLQTVSQWQKHSLEVLRLACEQAHLVSTGSRNVLARRLYDHHHRSASSSHQTILLPPPSNSIDLVSSPPLSINNVVNSSTPPSLVQSIDFQNILRDEFQNFLSINMHLLRRHHLIYFRPIRRSNILLRSPVIFRTRRFKLIRAPQLYRKLLQVFRLLLS